MFGSLLRRLLAIFPDRRAAVSPMLALMMVPLFGAVGMGSEASSWFLIQRAAQNAADAAVLAAASNACDVAAPCHTVQLSPTYADEAKAVSASYNFIDTQNSTTVVAQNKVTCPDGTKTCYQVTVTRTVPISLVKLVGYSGNTATAGVESIVATAIASAPIPANYCSIALGGGKSFTIDGGPNVNMQGCDLFSNGDLTCNGANSDTGVPYGEAAGASKCGATQVSGQAIKPDPFASLDTNPPIPTQTCSAATASQNTGDSITAASNIITSARSFASPVLICGNARLGNATGATPCTKSTAGAVNITVDGAIIEIYDGSLDLCGGTLQTATGGSVTIIFTGDVNNNNNCKNKPCFTHSPVDSKSGGAINIAAPMSGSLMGVAILQDSRLTGPGNLVDITYTGNNPSLGIQGLLYFPNSNLTISGAINKYALSCIGIIAKTIGVNGGGSIFANDAVGLTQDCPQAGLILPTVAGTVQTRQALVQ